MLKETLAINAEAFILIGMDSGLLLSHHIFKDVLNISQRHHLQE